MTKGFPPPYGRYDDAVMQSAKRNISAMDVPFSADVIRHSPAKSAYLQASGD
jgi:hypothetical protein